LAPWAVRPPVTVIALSVRLQVAATSSRRNRGVPSTLLRWMMAVSSPPLSPVIVRSDFTTGNALSPVSAPDPTVLSFFVKTNAHRDGSWMVVFVLGLATAAVLAELMAAIRPAVPPPGPAHGTLIVWSPANAGAAN